MAFEPLRPHFPLPGRVHSFLLREDPIVAEIHRIREQLWEACHGSAEEMAERQRRLQEQYKDRLIDVAEWNQQRQAKSRKML
jgi:hypothetical protein